jgi:hypothetical protein
MTASEQLARRIRGELSDLERAVARVGRAWEKARGAGSDQDLYLDAVALNLHGFYSGLERLFELVARRQGGDLPAGPSWHEQLLTSMTEEVNERRPAVLSKASAERLDEYRRFRHLVRNVYATNLLPERIASLVDGLPGLWAQLRAELAVFADFLDAGA